MKRLNAGDTLYMEDAKDSILDQLDKMEKLADSVVVEWHHSLNLGKVEHEFAEEAKIVQVLIVYLANSQVNSTAKILDLIEA